MRRTSVLVAAGLVACALAVAAPAAACPAGDLCCMSLPAGADIADVFKDKLGRTGPQLPAFGKLVSTQGVSSCLGVTTDPHTLGAYTCNGPSVTGSSDPHFYADHLDHYWVQRPRTCADLRMPADQQPDCFYPPFGLIYDLGGAANKVVLFPMIDHGPLPQEAFEYSVYLSDNPGAIDTVAAKDEIPWGAVTRQCGSFTVSGIGPDEARQVFFRREPADCEEVGPGRQPASAVG